MTHQTENGKTYIYLEPDESEDAALSAIAKASFEMAVPVGMGILHFQPAYQLSDADTNQILQAAKLGTHVLAMDYIQGRQCKTYITKNEDGVLCLHNFSYERDRGAPDEMLDRAVEILNSKEKP